MGDEDSRAVLQAMTDTADRGPLLSVPFSLVYIYVHKKEVKRGLSTCSTLVSASCSAASDTESRAALISSSTNTRESRTIALSTQGTRRREGGGSTVQGGASVRRGDRRTSNGGSGWCGVDCLVSGPSMQSIWMYIYTGRGALPGECDARPLPPTQLCPTLPDHLTTH